MKHCKGLRKDDMFNTSDVIITSLQELFKNFARDGVAKYPSENVALLVQQINSVSEKLAEVTEILGDKQLLILTEFTKCSMPEFFGSFELMLNTERFIHLYNDGDSHDENKFLERVNNLTLLASKYFHSLNTSKQWKIPSNHWNRMAKGKFPCDNFDGEH